MRLVALDLETTGTDPEKDQVLQIGMLCFDADTAEIVGEFEIDVRHQRYSGDAYALYLNREILGRLRDPNHGVPWVAARFLVFDQLEAWGFSRENKPHAVGFNVGTFDLRFGFAHLFHRRTVEIGSLLMRAMGSSAPVSSKEFQEFCSLEVAHTALEDCRMARNAYAFAMGIGG